MCSGFEYAMVALATASTATQIASAAQTPGMPDIGPLPKSKAAQTAKDANKQTANAIKSVKKRSGTPTPPTLLTGASGVGDEEINLGGTRLV